MAEVRAPSVPVLTAARGCFQFGGIPRFLVGGEMHYFRIDPRIWAASLRHLAEAGISVISSYIPWLWHEQEENRFDFSGQTDPRRNLLRFIEEVRSHGLYFMARPGPFIYAEYRGFGCPEWIARNYPETVALRASGRSDSGAFWHNYSLRHPTYVRLVKNWYAHVFEALKPFWNDPVVSLQLDNEAGFLYSGSLGKLDFNGDTCYRFNLYLREKYKSIETLNRQWKADHRSFSEVRPPARPFNQAQAMDWQAFLETWVDDYLTDLVEFVRAREIPVPLTHNEPCPPHNPASPRRQSASFDFIGFDLYIKETDKYHIADFPFANSIYPSLFKPYCGESRPLLSLELGMGWLDYRSRIYGETLLQNIMGSVAHGVKGFCLFPVHDCVEACGDIYIFQSILDMMGRKTENYPLIQKVISFLRANESELLRSREVYDPVAFSMYAPNCSFMADEYLPGQMIPDPLRYLAFLGSMGVMALMLSAGYNPRVIDPQMNGERDLDAFRLIFFPNKGYLDADTYRKLSRYVESGGTLVSYPKSPGRDLAGRLCSRPELYPAKVKSERWVGRPRLLLSLAWDYLIKYYMIHRDKIKKRHQTSLHIADIFEPLLCSIQVPLPSVSLRTGAGKTLHSDYVYQTYDSGPQMDTVFFRGRRAAAYRHRHGKGNSIVWGSLLGGRQLTPHYYRTPPSERRELLNFLHGVMHEAGITRRFETILEIETVIRETTEGAGFLFVLNRLGAQEGEIHFREMKFAQVSDVFEYRGSRSWLKGESELFLKLAANDVLVVRFVLS